MKKTLALVLAVAMLVALFAGCGNNGGTTPSTTPDAGTTGTQTTPDTGSNSGNAGTTTPDNGGEEDSPYNFANGNFPKDENGVSTAPYTYELPLSTTDEVLTMWTTNYTPQYIPTEGYASMSLPTADRELTGVNVEYTIIATDNLRTNFSVLRAADDLLDIMVNAATYYGGVDTDILKEGYFANLYEYRDYCPNFMYMITHYDPDDFNTYDTHYLGKEEIASMWMLYKNPVLNGADFVRADWMAELGLNIEDMVTWDDLFNLLTAFKSAGYCEYPLGLFYGIDKYNVYNFTSYDTIPYINDTILGPYFIMDGQVTFSHMNETDRNFVREINRFMEADLISPNWLGYKSGNELRPEADQGSIGHYFMTCADSQSAKFTNVDPDCEWVRINPPLRTADQQLKIGSKPERVLKSASYNIASTCENIPLAVTWCDWFFSEEGSELWSYGLEGEVWEYDENGNRVATDLILNNPDGLSYTWAICLHAVYMGAFALLFHNQRNFMDPTTGAASWQVAMDIIDWTNAHYPVNGKFPTGARLDESDQEIVNNLSSDIMTYCAENYTLFVTGDKDVETEWDAYVAGLMDIGMQDMIDAYQRAYDSYLAAKA